MEVKMQLMQIGDVVTESEVKVTAMSATNAGWNRY